MEVSEPTTLDFDGLTPEFIYVYQKHGAKGLRARLAEYVQTGICTREALQEPASELAAMKLMKQAKLVAKAALRCLPMTDDKFCNYHPLPTEPHIWAHWRQRQQYRANKRRKQIEALLHQAGLTPDWLGEGEWRINSERRGDEKSLRCAPSLPLRRKISPA
jgi:hypothetical protein